MRGERIKVVPKEFRTPQEQSPIYGVYVTKGIGNHGRNVEDAGLEKISTQMRRWLLVLPYM